MIGTRFYKNDYDLDSYIETAQWCNASGSAHIEDKGDYYEVVENDPLFSEEEIEVHKNVIQNRLKELAYVSKEIALGLAKRSDYSEEIEEIAMLHNELFELENM